MAEDDKILAEVQKVVGNNFGQASAELVVMLYPAFKKLALSELPVLIRKLENKDSDAVIEIAFSKMSNDELALAKGKLADLLVIAADENYQQRQVIRGFMVKAGEIALAAALGMVAL